MAPQTSPANPDFGIFEPVFQSAHGYLALLHLDCGDETEAVDLVRRCCQEVPNPYADICRLLADSNWRPHLVAAVAVIVSGFDRDVVKRMWHRVDSGSWVTPQIGVALYLVDPDFETQCRSRLEAECPIDVSELLAMTAPERHSAAGPGGTIDRSAKVASTLLQLLKTDSPVPGWVQTLAGSERMRSLLAQDMDSSSVITEKWLRRIKEITRRE